jgi:glycosyltransferase involved in cell wall biosynthesis
MRVLHIHSGNLYGGVETIMVTLARNRQLCPQMESHFALCFPGRLSVELQMAGAPVHFLGETRIRNLAAVRRGRRALQGMLLAGAFDLAVCHSSWSQALFGPTVRAATLPLVFWLHGEASGRSLLDLWASSTPPDLAICNSQFTATTLPRLYPRVRSEVVYCPIEFNGNASATERVATRAGFGASEDAVVIVQAGRIEEGKGHYTLLEALSLLSRLNYWQCWQIGGAQRPNELNYLIKLQQTARKLGVSDRVLFLGQQTNLISYLGAADIYCQPNMKPEGFGISFIEALWSGLPVVTSGIGGANEIIDESCGVLVHPGDPEMLAAALQRLITDVAERRRLGAAGPSRAGQLCNLETQLRKLYVALKSVCLNEN